MVLYSTNQYYIVPTTFIVIIYANFLYFLNPLTFQVGKSTLVNQFLWEAFIKEYRPTVEEFNWIEYEVEDGELLVQIIDSSGSRDFLAMRDLYCKQGDAFMVVYAVDDPSSYSEAMEIVEEIKLKSPKQVRSTLTLLYYTNSHYLITNSLGPHFISGQQSRSQGTRCKREQLAFRDKSPGVRPKKQNTHG